jgi:tetratricopeptide (TPR) repeat protein
MKQVDKAAKKEKRNKIKQALYAIIGAAVFFGGVYAVFYFTQNNERRELASRVAEYGPRKGVPRTIEDLQKAIAAYEDLQEQHVKDAAQTATYWKILATRFQDKQMYIEAVKALRRAIEINPGDEVAHYLTGMNAAQSAKSMYDYDEGEAGRGINAARYFNLAEEAYLRAIELEPEYAQARYGLAVLYVYELDRPALAVPQLLQYMENRSGDANAMFILARALYMTGEYNEAIEWYERGIPLSKDEKIRAEAQANRNYIMDLAGR